MDETVLDWTVPNWLTVILMVALGFAALKLGATALAKVKGGSE